jgi:hypothetical protein
VDIGFEKALLGWLINHGAVLRDQCQERGC